MHTLQCYLAVRYTAVAGCSWYEYWYRGTTVLAWDARVVPVDLAYVIFIEFLALGVLRFCFLLLSNVQFLVLVNLPPGLATRVEPQPTFSACFDAFLPLHPTVYANLLEEKLLKHGTTAYLVNTGWAGGPATNPDGSERARMDIPITRACITAILEGSIKDANWTTSVPMPL
eukprot:COSAG05_NODE_258_length_12741_cov_168.778279_12_plen_172_part_00